MSSIQPKLSIVSTLYKSNQTIEKFISSISKHSSIITDKFEIILVDDGSPDNSVDLAKNSNAPVKIIQFTKNFGHHHAMMAAIEHSRGDYVFLIDSDLEEDPSLLLEFWDEFQKQKNADVIYGVQENRKGGLIERFFGSLFYSIFNLLSEVKIPANLLTVRMMSRRYVDTLNEYQENSIFIGGLWKLAGYTQLPLTVRKGASSMTTYTIRKKIELVLESLTSFSSKPLVLLFRLSLILNLITVVFVINTVYLWLSYEKTISGYSTIIISIWMFGGLVLSATTIVGLYLSKIFIEVKKRPRYSIKEMFDNSPP